MSAGPVILRGHYDHVVVSPRTASSWGGWSVRRRQTRRVWCGPLPRSRMGRGCSLGRRWESPAFGRSLALVPSGHDRAERRIRTSPYASSSAARLEDHRDCHDGMGLKPETGAIGPRKGGAEARRINLSTEVPATTNERWGVTVGIARVWIGRSVVIAALPGLVSPPHSSAERSGRLDDAAWSPHAASH